MCLHKAILLSRKALRKAIPAELIHFHAERNLEASTNEVIVPTEQPANLDAKFETTERLAGMF